MAKPRLLLLDEPSLGLAPILVSEIFQTVKSLAQQEGVQVLLVEQNARKALDISDTGYVMVLGHIVFLVVLTNLRKPEVRKLYLEGKMFNLILRGLATGSIYSLTAVASYLYCLPQT